MNQLLDSLSHRHHAGYKYHHPLRHKDNPARSTVDNERIACIGYLRAIDDIIAFEAQDQYFVYTADRKSLLEIVMRSALGVPVFNKTSSLPIPVSPSATVSFATRIPE